MWASTTAAFAERDSLSMVPRDGKPVPYDFYHTSFRIVGVGFPDPCTTVHINGAFTGDSRIARERISKFVPY